MCIGGHGLYLDSHDDLVVASSWINIPRKVHAIGRDERGLDMQLLMLVLTISQTTPRMNKTMAKI